MKLEEWLRKEGMLRRAFAERIGASPSTVSLLINGQRKPSLEMAQRIQEATKGKVKMTEWRKGCSAPTA